MVNFDVTNEEAELIAQIAKRAILFAELGYTTQGISMDITAAHANGCKLRLRELSNAAIGHFCHDVFGIMANLDRRTGKLQNNFTPRYAA